MHRIRKQSRKKKSDGKLLLSLSIQSYAGHRHQAKVTIFSEERSRRDKSGVKPGFSPNRIKSKGQVGSWASFKNVFQESALLLGFKRAVLSEERCVVKKSLIP